MNSRTVKADLWKADQVWRWSVECIDDDWSKWVPTWGFVRGDRHPWSEFGSSPTFEGAVQGLSNTLVNAQSWLQLA